MKPEFETAKGVFRVTLPNRNEDVVSYTKPIINERSFPYTSNAENVIVKYAHDNGCITRREVEDLLSVGTTKACRLLKELCEADILKKNGSGRTSAYVVK